MSLDPSFERDLLAFERVLMKVWPEKAVERGEQVMRTYAQLWRGEAARRIPVETGHAGQTVISNGGIRQKTEGPKRDESGRFTAGPSVGVLFMEVGSNVPYTVFLEFGTKFIAGGAVLKFRDQAVVTDAQAIKSWEAKDADAFPGNTEQMPWLRPSFVVIRGRFVASFNDAFEPPRQGET